MKKINKVKIKINGKNFVIKPKMTLKEVITNSIGNEKVSVQIKSIKGRTNLPIYLDDLMWYLNLNLA